MIRDVPYTFEPKRKNRWFFTFPGTNVQGWMCQMAKRPAMTIQDTEIPFLNTSHWVAGRAVWEPLEITFIDVIGAGTNSTSAALMDWINYCVQFRDNTMNFARDYYRDITLQMLGPHDQIVESWEIKNAWVTTIDFNDLDMSSSDVATVTVKLRYDYAEQVSVG